MPKRLRPPGFASPEGDTGKICIIYDPLRSTACGGADTPDPAKERTRRRLRVLAELAEIGLVIGRGLREQTAVELARALRAQAAWTPPGGEPRRGVREGGLKSRDPECVRFFWVPALRSYAAPAGMTQVQGPWARITG
jgi:hypothetical protein